MKGLGLDVKTLEKPLYVNSPLRIRMSVDQIGQERFQGFYSLWT